jgi:hypothetical protein
MNGYYWCCVRGVCTSQSYACRGSRGGGDSGPACGGTMQPCCAGMTCPTSTFMSCFNMVCF